MLYVHGTEQGVDIQAATILGQWGQVEAWEVECCRGCRDSCPDPGPRPAHPCRTTTCPLAEEPPSLGGPQDHALMDSPFHQECRRVQL